MKNTIEVLQDYYGKRLRSGGLSYSQLGWENPVAHYERFRVLTREIDLNYQTVLDVGAGLGDLWHHLDAEGTICNYLGVDLLPAMVERARLRFPEVKFECCDVIENPDSVKGPFDIVYSAGIFNLSQTSNMAFLKSAFGVFTALAKKYVAISMLDIASHARENLYCYFDPIEVKRELARPGWELWTVEKYLHNDFTLFARRLEQNL